MSNLQATSPLAQLKDPSLLKTDALINGQWVPGSSRFAVTDPATGAHLADAVTEIESAGLRYAQRGDQPQAGGDAGDRGQRRDPGRAAAVGVAGPAFQQGDVDGRNQTEPGQSVLQPHG